MNTIPTLLAALSCTLLLACTTSPSQPAPSENASEKKPVAEIIPLTAANIRGHNALYDEGWYVITSSDKALDYAHEKSVVSSREAITAAAHTIANRDQTLKADIQKTWQLSKNVSLDTFQTGSRLTRDIYHTTTPISQIQVDYGQEKFRQGWQTFVKGNIFLGKRTQATRAELMAQPGHYFDNLREDFSNIYSLTEKAQSDYAQGIGRSWDGAFAASKAAFNAEYEQSGQASNSLTALANIFQGYAKGIYHGLVKPGGTTISKSAVAGAQTAAKIIFLPTATVLSVSGRSVQAIGTTVYVSGKLGVEIVSPTVEAGLLSGLGMLSLGSAPLTYVTGVGIGAVNQVAFTAASPIAGAATGTVGAAADSGKYVAFVSYDAITGISKVTLNQTSSAVVLGYNALTAIPAHLLMGVADSAVFLAYDGPRLVVAYAKGNVKSGDQTLSVDELPVGSVVNLQELKAAGADVHILSEDPAVINQVLDTLPHDLRE